MLLPMDNYASYISDLASGESTEIFYNSSEKHALIVLKNIVKNAKEYVKAICGNLCSEVSNDPEYLAILDEYLSGSPSRKFQILLDDYQQDFKTRPIATVLKRYPNQVVIRSLKHDYIQYKNNHIHLTVSDDKSFRLETNVEKKMAWGCFNDPEKSKVFSAAFDKFFSDTHSTLVAV